MQCKVIFCNIHTSWLQGLVSVARGPAALGWPQAACLDSCGWRPSLETDNGFIEAALGIFQPFRVSLWLAILVGILIHINV